MAPWIPAFAGMTAPQTNRNLGDNVMATRDELLSEVYEQAVYNEINYFG